jgi:uncharacterized membrane protein YhaH (DUF805 family)
MQLITYWKRAVLQNYANFNGRDVRSEYWWFVLASVLISVAFSIARLDIVGNLFSLAVLIPTIAAATRRLHDTGRSGWWQLLVLIPIVGFIILIVWLASEGKQETNQYGAPAAGGAGGGLSDPPLPPPPPPMPS